MNWDKLIDKVRGGREIFEAMGYDGYLPTDRNLVTDNLRNQDVMERCSKISGFNRSNLSKLATICQMAIYDRTGGPEGDSKRKGLRRTWYAFYKTDFAQPLSEWLGEDLQDSRWGLNWAGRLSQTYAWFVDEAGATYRDLWVEDASRMMKSVWDRLFAGCNILVAVEKDSLFSDFVAPAKALGARSVYSGKGKSSKAAIEKVLRDHFGWNENYEVFSADNPLLVLHISDHDYDGEAVIGPTFGEQARRYTDHVLEARVGIKPRQVEQAGHRVEDKWYQVKVSNSSAEKWADKKALFAAKCSACDNVWPVVGTQRGQLCPDCGSFPFTYTAKDGAHGFEVEALTTRSYYRLMVDALLTILPLELIVEKLRDECRANPQEAAERVAREIYEANRSYQELLAEFERLESIKAEFESRVTGNLLQAGRPMADNWRSLQDDPRADDFRRHAETANDWTGPWRPFNQELRTARLAGWLGRIGLVGEFKDEGIEF